MRCLHEWLFRGGGGEKKTGGREKTNKRKQFGGIVLGGGKKNLMCHFLVGKRRNTQTKLPENPRTNSQPRDILFVFRCLFTKKNKQHKHKLFGPDFPQSFPTLDAKG